MIRALLPLLFVFSAVSAQDIPTAPDPPRLVNDFADVLSPTERASLERKLNAYHDTTSTQIAVVIVRSLDGYEVMDYAVRLAEKWGVGQKGKNNGVVVRKVTRPIALRSSSPADSSRWSVLTSRRY